MQTIKQYHLDLKTGTHRDARSKCIFGRNPCAGQNSSGIRFVERIYANLPSHKGCILLMEDGCNRSLRTGCDLSGTTFSRWGDWCNWQHVLIAWWLATPISYAGSWWNRNLWIRLKTFLPEIGRRGGVFPQLGPSFAWNLRDELLRSGLGMPNEHRYGNRCCGRLKADTHWMPETSWRCCGWYVD